MDYNTNFPGQSFRKQRIRINSFKSQEGGMAVEKGSSFLQTVCKVKFVLIAVFLVLSLRWAGNLQISQTRSNIDGTKHGRIFCIFSYN